MRASKSWLGVGGLVRLAALTLLILMGGRAALAARMGEGPSSGSLVDASGSDALADGTRVTLRAEPILLQPVETLRRGPGQIVDGRTQTELIDELDFEDGSFPPENWDVDDQITRTFGPDSVDAWSRQICQTDPAEGGVAAAWAAGGGSNGPNYACGQNLGKPLGTRLFRDGVDTSGYPFGVQVDFTVYLDLPLSGDSARAMKVCWRESNSNQAQCSSIVINDARLLKRWLGLSAPIQFAEAANKPSIELMFWFDDDTGSGDYAGAFIDNVRIEGLTEAPPPTPTSANPVTPSPTRTVATATPSITRTPTERAKIAFLPVLLKSADKDDPSQVPSQYVQVWFGTAIDAADRVENIGNQFQYGAMRLCAQVNWFGWPDSTEVRWQWYQKSGSRFEEIPSSTLNDSVRVGQETRPYASRCIRAVDGDGQDVPIWLNEYKVDVFVDGMSPPAASGIAVISQDPPPGKTALPASPTPWPTGQPSPTPTPKATGGPPLPGGCSTVIENADFERGSAVGWTLATNANKTISDVIQRGADLALNAAGGDWLAVMGRGANVRDQLISVPFDFPEPAQMISATLNFSFGLVTQETKNGNHDDTMIAALVPRDGGQASTIPGTGISEELIDADSWYSLSQPIDMTQLLTARAGWSGAQLLFQSQNSADAPTAHILDEIELVLCVSDAPLAAPRPAMVRRPAGRLLTLPMAGSNAMAAPSGIRKGPRLDVDAAEPGTQRLPLGAR